MTKSKRKLGTRITVIAVALLMVLTVGLLGACDLSPDPAQAVQYDINSTEQQVIELNGESDPELSDIQALLQQVAELQNRVAQLEGQHAAMEQQLAEMQRKLEDMKNDQQQDFILTITVANATLSQGEDFVVSVRLMNNSGQDIEIATEYSANPGYFSSAVPLFSPQVAGWVHMGMLSDAEPDKANLVSIAKGMYIGRMLEVGSRGWILNEQGLVTGIESALPRGSHSLRYRATFIINWGTDTQQEVEVFSNPVVLTVQ